MDLKSKYYSDEEIEFILSKITDMDWWKIPESLKKFWADEFKKINNGK